MGFAGATNYLDLSACSAFPEQKIVPAYNLEVANAHTFFVGEDGVLVHNAKSACERYNELLEEAKAAGRGPVGRSGDNASIKAQAAQRLIEEGNRLKKTDRALADEYKKYGARKQAKAKSGIHPGTR
jgi:hypothetical protein